MATYNGSKYLREQLDSFVRQSRQPDELVVCDDGSVDGTLDILQSFRDAAPFRVEVECNTSKLGFTRNFEKALQKCVGDILFLSDQDDIWFPNKIEAVEKALIANPAKFVAIHDGELVDEELRWRGATKLGQVMAGFGNDDALVTGALTAIRREFLSYALPIPAGIIGHDVWLHRLARHLDTKLVLAESLQSIRRHSNNTSNWIASSTDKIGKFDVFVSYLRTTPASNYNDRIFINDACTARLRQIPDDIYSQKTIRDSLEYLAGERQALKRRMNIVRAGWLKRRLLSLQMLVRGNYRYFNGLGSFLRDMSR